MVRIDNYLIDVTIAEEHELPAEVTSHPIEDGADITDHVRLAPISVTLEGIVSDTPIGTLATTRAPDGKPSDDAYAFLKLVRSRREPVTIETSLETFDNMVLQHLSVPRAANNGDALRFRVTFVQVELVTNERTTIPTSHPRGQKKRNLGNRPTTATEDISTIQNATVSSLKVLFGGNFVEQ